MTGKTYSDPDWYVPAAVLTLIGGAGSIVCAAATNSPWVGAIGAGIALATLAIAVLVGELLW